MLIKKELILSDLLMKNKQPLWFVPEIYFRIYPVDRSLEIIILLSLNSLAFQPGQVTTHKWDIRKVQIIPCGYPNFYQS